MTVTFPVRDERVSPIEEVHVQANARDQFGLMDYGLAYSVGADDAAVSLAEIQGDAAEAQTQADFRRRG